MTRLKLSEIVIIVLALLGGLGFVFFAGTRLMVTAVSRAESGTGGSVFVVTGGLTTRLFSFLVLLVLALIVLTIAAVWRR